MLLRWKNALCDYYQILGISEEATKKEITNAYRKLAKTCHPDKVPGKEEDVKSLTTAYETLSDIGKRYDYDQKLREHQEDAKRRALKFFLADNPAADDHYTYYNTLFALEGDAKIAPGHLNNDEQRLDFLLEQIEAVSSVIEEERRALEDKRYRLYFSAKTLSPEEQKRLDFLDAHGDRIGIIISVLFSRGSDLEDDNESIHTPYRDLYDASLGFYREPHFREVVEQLGGKRVLQAAIKAHPRPGFSKGVFALHECQCLTPKNFRSLTWSPRKTELLADIFSDLKQANLLNQINIDLIVRYSQYRDFAYLKNISQGIVGLKRADLLQQTYFEDVIYAGQYGSKVGYAFEDLKSFNLFNDENYQTIVRYPPRILIYQHLRKVVSFKTGTKLKEAINAQ